MFVSAGKVCPKRNRVTHRARSHHKKKRNGKFSPEKKEVRQSKGGRDEFLWCGTIPRLRLIGSDELERKVKLIDRELIDERVSVDARTACFNLLFVYFGWNPLSVRARRGRGRLGVSLLERRRERRARSVLCSLLVHCGSP